MALSLSRAFGAMGAEAARFDRRRAVVDPELGLMSAEDVQLANFMLPGSNTVRAATRHGERGARAARARAHRTRRTPRTAPLQSCAPRAALQLQLRAPPARAPAAVSNFLRLGVVCVCVSECV